VRDGVSAKIDDKEKFSLAGKGKKSNDKKAQGKIEYSQNGGNKKKDLSKVKCFHCHESGHYATKCPNTKSNKHVVETTKGEAISY